MEVFNKIFKDGFNFEATHDYSKQPMAMGKSKSHVLSMLNDEVESCFYTQGDRRMEKMFLKDLISNKEKEPNVAEFIPPERHSRRPGEFTEVDFPQVSLLTKKQMRIYSNLLEANKNKCLDPKDDAEFEQLNEAVKRERENYQAFARHQWVIKNYHRLLEIKPSVKSYIDDVWQSRIKRLHKLAAKYYQSRDTIALTFNDVIDSENPVTLKMGSVLFATGTHNSFVVPPLLVHPRAVTYLPTDYQTLTENRHPDHEFLPPVSQDKIAEYLLKESDEFKNDHTVVVLSASGLKTIADTDINSSFSPWMLPITIKEFTIAGNKKRKVVFIDKKLPPENLSIKQRMKWYAKIAARMIMCKSNEKSDEAEVNPSTSCNMSEGDENKEVNEDENEMMDVEDDFDSVSKCKVKRKPVWSAGHREYRVWQVGKETQNHLMKNQAGQIKILLRTKYDGKWARCNNKLTQNFTVAAKLDYQCEYGGDRLTTSECIRQWTDLHIRPGSFLKRARINPLTSEFMQLQTVSEADMLTQMRTDYAINPHSIANSLYSIIGSLIQKPPGKYLLEHTVKCPGFCTLHVEIEEYRPKCLELETRYPKHAALADPPELRAPFIPLDPKFTTSNCYYRSVLPLTFPPRANAKPILKPKYVTGKKKLKNKPKKKNKKKKNKKNIAKSTTCN